jgi:hypothetical protein
MPRSLATARTNDAKTEIFGSSEPHPALLQQHPAPATITADSTENNIILIFFILIPYVMVLFRRQRGPAVINDGRKSADIRQHYMRRVYFIH